MAKLIVIANGSPMQETSIVKIRTTIGRGPSNDLILEHLSVSGSHASVVRWGESYFLRDEQSFNGTFLRGERVSKAQTLNSGDVFSIASYQIRFESEAAAASPPGWEGGTQYEPAPDLGAPSAFMDTLPPTPTRRKRGVLLVLTGSSAGREIELSKQSLTIGKTGLLVVSIRQSNGLFELVHVVGEIRARVNGAEVTNESVVLMHGDTIELGQTRLAFRLKPA